MADLPLNKPTEEEPKGIPEEKWPKVIRVQNRRIRRAYLAMEREQREKAEAEKKTT